MIRQVPTPKHANGVLHGRMWVSAKIEVVTLASAEQLMEHRWGTQFSKPRDMQSEIGEEMVQ